MIIDIVTNIDNNKSPIEIKKTNLKSEQANGNRLKIKKLNEAKQRWDPYSIAGEINLLTGIADPDNYISDKSEITALSRRIKEDHQVQVFVFIISEIDSTYFDSNLQIKKTYFFLTELSKALVKKYTINDDNSVLILFSVKDRQCNIRSGLSLRKYFRKRDIEKILGKYETYLKKGEYSRTAQKILKDISSILDSANSKLIRPEYILILIILSAITMLYFIYKKSKRVKLTKSNKSEAELKYKYRKLPIDDVLAKFEIFNKSLKTSKELAQKYCLICLEKCNRLSEQKEQDGEGMDILKTEEIKYEPVTILNCGHFYHYDCIHYWMDIHMKDCPSCKWKVDDNKKVKKKNEKNSKKYNFLNGVVQIHSIINTNFQYYDLKITNCEISWTIPSIEEDDDNLKEEDVEKDNINIEVPK